MHGRKWLVAAAFLVAPSVASAGGTLSASLGKGLLVDPEVETQPTNIMVAPGYSVAIIRAELGLVASLGDVENSEFDMEVRPMLVIDPPILPIHARAILAVQNLLGDGDTVIAYGGAIGFGASLFGLGAYVEAGVLPRSVDVGTETQTWWVAEARAGIIYEF